MKNLLDEIRFSSSQISLNEKDYKDDWKRSSSKYNCRLRFNNKSMTVKFYCGCLANRPSKKDVLYCLIADDVTDMAFEDFCSEFGYDIYSKKDLKIFNSCERQTERLYNLFGSENVEELKELLQDY